MDKVIFFYINANFYSIYIKAKILKTSYFIHPLPTSQHF